MLEAVYPYLFLCSRTERYDHSPKKTSGFMPLGPFTKWFACHLSRIFQGTRQLGSVVPKRRGGLKMFYLFSPWPHPNFHNSETSFEGPSCSRPPRPAGLARSRRCQGRRCRPHLEASGVARSLAWHQAGQGLKTASRLGSLKHSSSSTRTQHANSSSSMVKMDPITRRDK